jgi:hypothetical protein
MADVKISALPAAGMTSQLLNWYEEGTWTPTDASGAALDARGQIWLEVL